MEIDTRTGYFICETDTGVVYTSGCIKYTMKVELPDGRLLFRAELWNGLDIILIAERPVQVGDGLYSQKFTVFDEPFTRTYHEHMEVRFYVNDSVEQYYNVGIRVVDRKSDSEVGDLIYSEDVIAFEQEIISDKESRRLYLKAAILKG